ncbi:DUF2288 domain-containing protein [Pseudomonas sp. Z2-20]
MKEKDRLAAGLVRSNRQSLALLRFSIGTAIATGFFCQTTDVIIRADFFSGQLPMNQEPSTLYAKLLGETASITWKELEPFFAKGALLWVDPALDLIAAAEAVAQDEGTKVAAWLAADQLAKLSETRALDFVERDPQLWAVVVSPWILIQERASN